MRNRPPRERACEIRSCYEESVAAYPGLEVEIVREFPLGDTSAIEFDAVLVDGAGFRHRYAVSTW